MSKKHKKNIIDNNVYVLDNDYTYHIIDNSNMSIIKACNNSHSKYLLFPINSKSGTKYILDKKEYVPYDIKLRIEGKIAFVTYGGDYCDISDVNDISLEANSIAEYYAVMGSLYNIEVCSYMTDTQYMEYEIRPALLCFEIYIKIGDKEYLLNPDLYKEVVPTDEFDVSNQLSDTILTVYNLINYIEHTVSNKEQYENIISGYRSFMLYNDGTYSKLQSRNRSSGILTKTPRKYTEDGKIPQSKIDNSVVILDTDTPLYISVPYNEFNSLRSNDMYQLSYVQYYTEINTPLNAIPDEDLSVEVITEIDGADYNVLHSDDISFSHINQIIFTLLSLNDINIILQSSFPWYDELVDTCFTVVISKEYDKTHKYKVIQSSTGKMISNGFDILSKIVYQIHTNESMGLMNK